MGDFNVSYNSNSGNKKLKSVITANVFRQIVKEPTRIRPILDAMLCCFFRRATTSRTEGY